MAADPNFDCDQFLPGNGCKLPLLPGHYGGEWHGDDTIDIILPEDLNIPDILKPFLNGKIKIHLSIAANGSEVVCAEATLHIDA